jgi:GTP-binding protein Era
MQSRIEETMADDLDVAVLVLNARERIGAGDRYVARSVFELRQPGRDRTEQGRPAEARPHRRPDEHGCEPRRLFTRCTRSARGPATASASFARPRSRFCPRGRFSYPDGEVTDMLLEARIAESVREQALRVTREEVPHALTAEVVEIEDGHVHVRLSTKT